MQIKSLSNFHLLDVIGIGIGPSNLALMISLSEELSCRSHHMNFRFIESKPKFDWHGGMLLPDSSMQISFLKDLVSLRTPTSPYSFVNYLHNQGRLEGFINCKTFYPKRVEYNKYLEWVSNQFLDISRYGEEVTDIEPVADSNNIHFLRVQSSSLTQPIRHRYTKNLVVSVGGKPRIPTEFSKLTESPKVIHSGHYLSQLFDSRGSKIRGNVAVIGAGQSAAEISLDLLSRFEDVSVTMIFRGTTLRPADSSPFVNEIFNSEFTDYIYNQPQDMRKSIIEEFRCTNYSVIDEDVIRKLYEKIYQQKVNGGCRLKLLPKSVCINVVAEADKSISLDVLNNVDKTIQSLQYDAVILATGYDRSSYPDFMKKIAPYIIEDQLNRNYQLKLKPGFLPKIFLQGLSEPSHGISDSLLSILPFRASEIANSILS